MGAGACRRSLVAGPSRVSISRRADAHTAAASAAENNGGVSLPPPRAASRPRRTPRYVRHLARLIDGRRISRLRGKRVSTPLRGAHAHGTRLVGTLPPLAPPSVRGERSILCKQVLTEDSTSSPSPSLSRAKVSGCSRSVRLARMTSARECTYGPKPHAHALISGTASLMSA